MISPARNGRSLSACDVGDGILSAYKSGNLGGGNLSACDGGNLRTGVGALSAGDGGRSSISACEVTVNSGSLRACESGSFSAGEGSTANSFIDRRTQPSPRTISFPLVPSHEVNPGLATRWEVPSANAWEEAPDGLTIGKVKVGRSAFECGGNSFRESDGNLRACDPGLSACESGNFSRGHVKAEKEPDSITPDLGIMPDREGRGFSACEVGGGTRKAYVSGNLCGGNLSACETDQEPGIPCGGAAAGEVTTCDDDTWQHICKVLVSLGAPETFIELANRLQCAGGKADEIKVFSSAQEKQLFQEALSAVLRTHPSQAAVGLGPFWSQWLSHSRVQCAI